MELGTNEEDFLDEIEDFEEEPYFVQIEAELLPFEDIEIGWATKDAENTVEDVLSSYMSAIFMFALGQINEEDLDTIESNSCQSPEL